ncbi:MAG: cupin domain-containing protein [Candidatus Omnitrophica bacterium]|nr:cupin domain-containing protein [Candidatus Omnitrophota bacterium]
MIKKNLLDGDRHKSQEEILEALFEGKTFRVERIVSDGHQTPPGHWEDQPEHEWVILLKGRARLQFEEGNQEIDMFGGDYVNIPAHVKHRVLWTDRCQKTVWLAIHYS